MLATHFRSAPCQVTKLLPDTWHVYVPDSQNHFILPEAHVQILALCNVPNTLEEHFNRIRTVFQMKPEQQGTVEEMLHGMRSSGLIVDASTLYPAPHAGSERPYCPISSIGFVTANRPDVLGRALSSYGGNLAQHARQIETIIMDDSSSEPARRQSLQVAARSCVSPNIRYGGLKEKQLYIKELARIGINPHVASFALLGITADPEHKVATMACTIGANRNCLLLDTVGRNIFSADDDTVCSPAFHPNGDNIVRLVGHQIPRDAWFYDSQRDLMQNTRWNNCDIIGHHERLLGKEVSQVLAVSVAQGATIDDACNHILSRLKHGIVRVAATMSGIVGDSGMDFFALWFMRPDTTRRLLVRDEALCRIAFRSRHILWVAQSHTMTHSAFFQGTTLGLANSEVLPPFLPLGRKEDGVFGVLVGATTSLVIGHVPVALLHAPSAGRTYQRFSRFELADLLVALVECLKRPQQNDLQIALRQIGKDLLDVCRWPDHEFWPWLVQAVTSAYANLLVYNNALLKEIDVGNAYLKNELSEYSKHAIERLSDNRCYIPGEISTGEPFDSAREQTRSLLWYFGSLLHQWPDIIAAAHRLNENGLRISKPIRP